jgi:Arc/MetJ-type ribon-helix-helix transcriptional regulator
MTTLSVPLPAHLEKFVNDMVASGDASNKADVVRRALMHYEEYKAVQAVLQAEKEPILRGDLRELAKKLA